MKNLAIKLIKLLLAGDLSLAQRNELSTLILDKLDSLPLRAILEVGDGGQLLIDGSPVDIDRARMLHEFANAALDNKAEQLIERQIMWVCMVNGLHNGDTPEKLYFYRSAIWWGQQRTKLLHLLAQRESPSYS